MAAAQQVVITIDAERCALNDVNALLFSVYALYFQR